MTEPQNAVYRAVTREAAERLYHADARARLANGYVPASEDWSLALGQQVLSVTYVHAPDQAPEVLAALDAAAATPPAVVAATGPANAQGPSKPSRSRSAGGLTLSRRNIAIGVVALVVLAGVSRAGQLGSAPSAAPPTSAPTVPGVRATTAPVAAPTTLPVAAPTTAPAPTAAPNLSLEQQNAIGLAQDYLDYTAFSRSGLIDQLVFEGFSTKVATFAVDYLDVNWKEQAWLMAKAYLEYSHFSRSSLIDQLEFEGFTHAQAVYGVDKVGL